MSDSPLPTRNPEYIASDLENMRQALAQHRAKPLTDDKKWEVEQMIQALQAEALLVNALVMHTVTFSPDKLEADDTVMKEPNVDVSEVQSALEDSVGQDDEEIRL